MTYKLLLRIPDGIKEIVNIFEKYVCECGKSALETIAKEMKANPRIYLETLMHLHDKYLKFCSIAFNDEPAFGAAIDKAFGFIINQCTTSTAETFAKYCDYLLKKNNKVVNSEKEIEEYTSKSINLFKYIDDKDIFQRFYSRYLAKRLINSSSISEDLELLAQSNLKIVCGFEYTSKLQRMFTDMTISKELSKHFKEYAAANGQALKYEIDIHVLTAGSWPFIGTNIDYQIPLTVRQGLI